VFDCRGSFVFNTLCWVYSCLCGLIGLFFVRRLLYRTTNKPVVATCGDDKSNNWSFCSALSCLVLCLLCFVFSCLFSLTQQVGVFNRVKLFTNQPA
jgi:hypothetical protein